MIVADASAVVAALLSAGVARQRLGSHHVHVPHLVDTEVTSALRSLVRRGEIADHVASDALAAWRSFGVRRHNSLTLLDRVWQLRHAVSAYDATYVALAEALSCPLLTADARLAAAPGPRCSIEVAPRS